MGKSSICQLSVTGGFSLVKADSVDRILTPTSGSPHPVWTSTNGRFRDYQKKKHALLILTNIHLVFFSTVMFTLTQTVWLLSLPGAVRKGLKRAPRK